MGLVSDAGRCRTDVSGTTLPTITSEDGHQYVLDLRATKGKYSGVDWLSYLSCTGGNTKTWYQQRWTWKNMTQARNNVVGITQQSKPIDLHDPYNAAWVASRTIVITGGASGFGEGFFRKWAENGANVIVGDINDSRGKALVEEVRTATGNDNLHYIHCDVTDWQSQVDFFRSAIQLSPNGGIDAVVANAGMTDPQPLLFQNPKDLDAEEPPKYDITQ